MSTTTPIEDTLTTRDLATLAAIAEHYWPEIAPAIVQAGDRLEGSRSVRPAAELAPVVWECHRGERSATGEPAEMLLLTCNGGRRGTAYICPNNVAGTHVRVYAVHGGYVGAFESVAAACKVAGVKWAEDVSSVIMH